METLLHIGLTNAVVAALLALGVLVASLVCRRPALLHGLWLLVLIKLVTQRAVAYRKFNDLPPDASVPVDAVTASASGLDPDISIANALDQAPRVARARHLPAARVIALVHQYTTPAQWGFLSEPAVNVLELNLDLDSRKPMASH